MSDHCEWAQKHPRKFFNFIWIVLGMALWVVAMPSAVRAEYTADLGVTYNGHGEVSSIMYPDGEVVDYTFTLGGLQETSALSATGTVLGIDELDAGGSVLSATYASGEELRLRYDDLGRPTQRELHRGSDALYQMRKIRYDAWGYVRSAERRDRLFPVVTELGYHYTSQGQLAAFEMGGQTTTYNYDSTGNLTARSGMSFGVLSLAPRAESYDAANRVTGWSYDAAGRVIEDDQYRYTYNAAGRLALVENAENGDVVAHYLYDAAGLRVRTLEDQRVIYHRRDASGAVLYEEEQSTSGEMLERRDFVLHNDQSVLTAATDPDGQVSGEYTFTDRLGNPAVRWDESGHTKLQEYAPYGEQMFAAAVHVGAHGFTGHDDDSTGLTYMQARFYDAVTARFLQPDPARDFDPNRPSTFNLYQYAFNSPVNRVDPSGRQSRDLTEALRELKNTHLEKLDKLDGFLDFFKRGKAKRVARFLGDLISNIKEIDDEVSKLTGEDKGKWEERLEVLGDVVDTAADSEEKSRAKDLLAIVALFVEVRVTPGQASMEAIDAAYEGFGNVFNGRSVLLKYFDQPHFQSHTQESGPDQE